MLDEAASLIARRQFGIAVVVAHMACEVAAQWALSAAFGKRGIGDLEAAVSGFFSGYNLGNDRLRGFYVALTADDIGREPFWAEFRASVKRRNTIIHEGKTATETEAKESLDATTAFVQRVAPTP